MGTRSDIIIKRPGKEEYASIYCHWDGYPSHNGRILLENYTTHDDVVALIQEGDMSVLEVSPWACTTYNRWRGEAKNIKVSNHVEDLVQQEYSYLFKDSEWFYKGWSHKGWKKLTAQECRRG